MTRTPVVQVSEATRELVAGMYLELVPMKDVEAAVADLAPGSRVSVTCSPAKGLGATQDLVGRLVDLGHAAVPHLAARQVVDRDHVARLAEWIRRRGLREVFVIAGDCPKPVGSYADSLSFLRDLFEHDTGLERVGVASYPDGHPLIDRAVLHEVLHLKQALLATVGVHGSATTQMCFDAARIRTWLSVERCDGLTMPVAVGVPGVVERGRLLKMGVRIGVGASLRYLRKNRAAMAALLAPGGYDPTALVTAVASDAAELGVTALHSYTFNSVAATRAWQDSLLDEDVAGRV
jgi:methylenetetrahydrofolate reductase (NADH)